MHLNAVSPVVNLKAIDDLDHKLSLKCHFCVIVMNN